MKKITAVIIAKDEESNLPRCLDSIKWVDEIIVVDSGSTDSTETAAQKAGAKVFNIEWEGFGPAKRFGVSQSSSDWVLSLDADEEIPPALAEEIKSKLEGEPKFDGFFIPRRTLFLGRWIKHCGWYPDYVLRLFDKNKGGFDGAVVHEKVILSGKIGYLGNNIKHYSYPSLEHYLRKFNRYTSLGAEELFRQNKSAGFFDIALKPPISFFKHYIMKQGFRDGTEGFLVSFLSAVSVMVKNSKLRELRRKNKEWK